MKSLSNTEKLNLELSILSEEIIQKTQKLMKNFYQNTLLDSKENFRI